MALPCLRACLPDEPERSWQLMRRMARAANDWITVDSLADVFAQGILAEPFRWAELEQLVYSANAHGATARGRRRSRACRTACPCASALGAPGPGPVLELIGQLIGDADAQVQQGPLVGPPGVEPGRARRGRPGSWSSRPPRPATGRTATGHGSSGTR